MNPKTHQFFNLQTAADIFNTTKKPEKKILQAMFTYPCWGKAKSIINQVKRNEATGKRDYIYS